MELGVFGAEGAHHGVEQYHPQRSGDCKILRRVRKSAAEAIPPYVMSEQEPTCRAWLPEVSQDGAPRRRTARIPVQDTLGKAAQMPKKTTTAMSS